MERKNNVLEFFITTLNGMAYGLFTTLIIGTILSTIGGLFPANSGSDFVLFLHNTITSCAKCLQSLLGAGIGVGVALLLKCDSLKTIVLGGVGEISAYFSLSTKFVTDGIVNNGAFQIGDPLTIYLVVICVYLLMSLVLKKKTPVDILIVPLFGIAVGLILSLLLRYPLIYVTYTIQFIVDKATLTAPFIMGVIVSIVMGMALTAPISSAAIAAMIFSGEGLGLQLASGAAVVGCSTQMVGFFIQSRKDNPIGMMISIGVGTSMLEFKNILRKPIIWLPTIIVSGILGPISTCLLQLKCMGSSAGMGTAGFVGQIGTFSSMGYNFNSIFGVIVLEILAPLILVFLFDLLFRKLGWIKDGDLKV